MAAPKGNQFWKLQNKHGRDKIFSTPEIMWKAACEYFEWCDNNPFQEEDFIKGGDAAGSKVSMNRMRPYTIQGLCLYLGVNTMYFNQFEHALKPKEKETDKAFSIIITRIRETIYDQKFSGAAAGFFKENIIARDLRLADKQESEIKLGVNAQEEYED